MNKKSSVEFPGLRRLHVGIAVSDIDRSRHFYTTLLGTAPSKQRPDYVKFEPSDPSVNLTLHQTNVDRISDRGKSWATHYGVQVKSAESCLAGWRSPS